MLEEVLTGTAMPERMVKQLLAKSEPKDPIAYGHYVRDKMREMPRLIDSKPHDDLTRDSRFEAVIDRLLPEIVRVSNMPGGPRTALSLFVELKIDILPSDRERYPSEFCIRKHGEIDGYMSSILRKADACSNKTFLNLVATSLQLKTRMSSIRCCLNNESHHKSTDNACQFNVLIPALDLLQRHAYFEVKSLVRLAVRNRLPNELTQLIFEETLLREHMTNDP